MMITDDTTVLQRLNKASRSSQDSIPPHRGDRRHDRIPIICINTASLLPLLHLDYNKGNFGVGVEMTSTTRCYIFLFTLVIRR